LNQADYRKLVSGRSTGLSAAFLRLLLRIPACAYWLVVRLRNIFYDRGLFKARRAGAAVISIGNITAGGAGKTPLVIWLCNRLSRSHECAILTRGYKTPAGDGLRHRQGPLLDEPAILAESCPDAKVVVNPDRVAGAAEAVGFGAEVLIMDDGFQHRRLARDLDIVAIDATMPFGFGKMLPAGLLREPIAALKRADAVVITRSDQVADAELAKIEKTIRHIKANIAIARSIHAPLCAIDSDANEISIEKLKGKKIFAFCGIGNPDTFFNTITNLGANILGSRIFDDHHHYTDSCLAEISKQAERVGAELAMTTQKDWTKWPQPSRRLAPILATEKRPAFAYLAVEIRFQAGEDKLTDLIEDTLTDRISRK
jgi:tetraacyldisaccharide 4'-kinase